MMHGYLLLNVLMVVVMMPCSLVGSGASKQYVLQAKDKVRQLKRQSSQKRASLPQTSTSTKHMSLVSLRAATNESQKTRNKNQETKRFSTFAVSRLRHSETKKTLLDWRIKFSAKHV